MQVLFDIFILIFAITATFKWLGNISRQHLNYRQEKYVNGLLSAGIVLKLVIIVIWYMVVGGYELNPSIIDSWSYHLHGQRIASSLRNFELLELYEIHKLLETRAGGTHFSFYVGIIYAFFGPYHIVVSICNTLLAVWLAIMVLEITANISKSANAGIYAFTGAMFYPHFISGSYFLLKGVVASFLVTGILWFIYCSNRSFGKMLGIVFFITLLSFIRVPLALIVGGMVALIIIHNPNMLFKNVNTRNNKFFKKVTTLFLISGFVFAVTQITFVDKTITSYGYSLDGTGDEYVRFTAQGGGLKEAAGYFGRRPVLLIRRILSTFIRIFYGPFFLYASTGVNLAPYHPSEVGFRAVLECFGGAFTGLLMPMIVFGWWYIFKKHRLEVIIWGFPCIWIMAMVMAGTIIRWRLPMMPIVFILFGIGMFQSRHKIRQIYMLYILAYGFFISINVSRLKEFYMLKAALLAFAIVVCLEYIKNLFVKWKNSTQRKASF